MNTSSTQAQSSSHTHNHHNHNNTQQQQHQHSTSCESALTLACENGHTDVVDALIKAGADPNQGDPDKGFTPLIGDRELRLSETTPPGYDPWGAERMRR